MGLGLEINRKNWKIYSENYLGNKSILTKQIDTLIQFSDQNIFTKYLITPLLDLQTIHN